MVDYAALLGAIPSPADDRDYQFSALLTPDQQAAILPSAWSAPPIPPNLTQTGGTCVGFSTTAMRLSAQKRDLGVWLDLDPYDMYRRAKKYDGLPPGTEGSTVRAAMVALKKEGQSAGPGTLPAKNRVSAYYAVARDYDSIKRAIKAYGGIVIATPWYESWFKPGRNGVLRAPDTQAGGHAIYAIGWDDRRGLLLRNSWSRGWGITGNCFLPAEYVPDIWEAWKSIDLPG